MKRAPSIDLGPTFWSTNLVCCDDGVRGGAVVVPVLSLLVPLGAYGGLTAIGVDSSKAGELTFALRWARLLRSGHWKAGVQHRTWEVIQC